LQLVSKFSNLCDLDSPTSQTDGHTDDMGDTENAGLEIAGLENPGPNDRGGKRRTGKCGTDKVWKA